MRVIVHCGVIAALLLSVALAAPQGDHEGHDHGPHTADHHHHLHHGEDEPHPQHEGEHSMFSLSRRNAEFVFTLYKKLSALPEQSKNIFFSPLSISMALSMLALGAKGDTFSQMYQALGYAEMTPETVNEAFEHIFHMLGHEKENMQLDTSSAIALKEGVEVLDTFLEQAKHHFGSTPFTVDFTKPDVATEEINKYIAQQTNNTITDMVKEVDPDTLMMLINCIYFRGEWQKPFTTRLTKPAGFHVDENTKVIVDMMQSEGEYEFYEDKENFTTVLRLPYKGSASMIVVLPDEGKMKEVEDTMSAYHLRHWVNAMEEGPVKVHMPKYSISGRFSLKDTLQAMGVVTAFSDTADFSPMTSAPVKVSKVEHQAVLNVHEKGTEAAAVTTIEIVLRGIFIPQRKVIEINRPFFVFLTDKSIKSILFMGKISNPAEK